MIRRFIACRNDQIWASEDGLSWQMVLSQNNSWRSLAYSESLQRVVAVGISGVNRVAYSDDFGETWTLVPAAEQSQWSSVKRSDELGIFVAGCNATGAASNSRAMISEDGIDWQIVPPIAGTTRQFSVQLYSSHKRLFIGSFEGGGSGHRGLVYSEDGLNWELDTSLSNAPTIPSFTARLSENPENGLLLFPIEGGTVNTKLSRRNLDFPNSHIWTYADPNNPPARDWRWSLFDLLRKRFVAIGGNHSGSTDLTNRVGISEAGIFWQGIDTPIAGDWRFCHSIVLDRIVTLCGNTNRSMISDDGGETWTIAPGTGQTAFQDIIYTNPPLLQPQSRPMMTDLDMNSNRIINGQLERVTPQFMESAVSLEDLDSDSAIMSALISRLRDEGYDPEGRL